MNHTNVRNLRWAAVLGAAVMLAACSDNDESTAAVPPSPPPPQATGDVPASAQASVSAWTTFVSAQGKTETGKPLDLTNVVAPFSDSEAPQPI